MSTPASILPVVEKIDRALDPVRARPIPNIRISVTGLPAIAARNSARMIAQLNESIADLRGVCRRAAGFAFRSVFVGVVSLLPGLFPVVTVGRVPLG